MSLRAAVLGGVDGVITSFAIVAASDVGGVDRTGVAVIGFANLFADATSMGVGTYLSVNAERALLVSKREDVTRLRPVAAGTTCFVAFVACGLVPLGVYLATASLLSSASFAVVTLALLGTARARVADEALLRAFGETTLLGVVAGGVAYGVGVLTQRIQ
jgi:VIT1/CCC1 family predicted Fe2+/Mn2+ transporter